MKSKVALVTGAASGLGRATALQLAHAGADVCVVDMNAVPLEDTAVQLRALGVRVLVHATDMVAFLASDAARGYHGASISIDAGITAG